MLCGTVFAKAILKQNGRNMEEMGPGGSKNEKREPKVTKTERKGTKREPKGAKREPRGAKREPKGTEMDPKVSQRATKMHPKIDLRKRSRKGSQKGPFAYVLGIHFGVIFSLYFVLV